MTDYPIFANVEDFGTGVAQNYGLLEYDAAPMDNRIRQPTDGVSSPRRTESCTQFLCIYLQFIQTTTGQPIWPAVVMA
jgi:hypothetical protein